LSDLTLGSHTLTVQALDDLDNASNIATGTFTVDHSFPVVQITFPVHGDLLRATIDIEGTASILGGNTIESVKVDPDESDVFYNVTDMGVTDPFDIWEYPLFDSSTVADGPLIIKAFTEGSNQKSSMVQIAVTVDNTAPSVVITSHSNGEPVSGNITLAGTALDATSGISIVSVKIDSFADDTAGGTDSWSYPIDTTAYTEDVHTIAVTVTDLAGNVTMETIDLYFDQTPPHPVINVYTDGDFIKGNGLTIGGTVTDLEALSTIEISFDNGVTFGGVGTATDNGGGNWDWSHLFDTVSIYPDGNLDIVVRTTDSISTAVSCVSVTLVVDNTTPTGAISSPTAGSGVSGTVLVTGTASDNIGLDPAAGVNLVIDDGIIATPVDVDLTVSNGNWNYSWDTTGYDTTPNIITLTLTLTDIAGNTTVHTVDNVSIDTSLPSVTIGAPVPGDILRAETGVDFIVSGTALDDAGTATDVTGVEVVIDGSTYPATYGAGTWSLTITDLSLSDGDHVILARVDEGDGGQAETSISVTIDNTDPVVVIDYPTAANVGADFLYGDVMVFGTASDTYLDTVDFSIDGGTTWIPVTGTDTWSYLWDTATDPAALNGQVVSIRAIDLAGNETIETVTVDVRPKITSLSSTSVLLGDVITLNGFNFNNTLANYAVNFTAGAGATTGTLGANTPTTQDVTVPAGATSGDVTLQEGATIIESNSIHLDVWDNTVIGNTGSARHQDLDIEGTTVHQVVYRGGGTKEMWYSNGGAAVQIDALESEYPAMDVEGSNVGIVAIQKNGDLKYFHSTDGGTTKPARLVIEAGAAALADTSIDRDSTGLVGITYQDSGSSQLFYRTSADLGATWGPSEVISTGGRYAEMVYDTDDTALIAYYDETSYKAMFGYQAAGSWNVREIESSLYQGEYIAMSVDSTGGIHLSYYDGNSGDLKYAYAASRFGSFSITTVAATTITGFYTDIVLDGSGNPHIASIHFNSSEIRYSYYDGFQWINVDAPLAIGAVGLAPLTIKFDSNGEMYIGYVSGDAGQLTYLP
jgi:hypothetical protein